jgi:hypothetical protein
LSRPDKFDWHLPKYNTLSAQSQYFSFRVHRSGAACRALTQTLGCECILKRNVKGAAANAMNAATNITIFPAREDLSCNYR